MNDAAPPSPDIIRPLPAVVQPPFPPAASNSHMKSGELRTSACLDTPKWTDKWGQGCDIYEECNDCPYADDFPGEMGPATEHCCRCGGESHTLPPTNSRKPSSYPSISSHPTQFCLDTPNWKDKWGQGCNPNRCSNPDFYAGDMGPATEHCCYCGGGISTVSQNFCLIVE